MIPTELEREMAKFMDYLQCHDLPPELVDLVKKLQQTVLEQYDTIKKLQRKCEIDMHIDIATQTDQNDCRNEASAADGGNSSVASTVKPSEEKQNLFEDIKQVATEAMNKTGFVYEETSGLYYDYNSGYYYNAECGLYYDGNTGTYLNYNQEKQEYQIHSKVVTKELQLNGAALMRIEKKMKTKIEQDEETKEDGECSESDDGEELDLKMDLDEQDNGIPCIRMMVKQSTAVNLQIGSLHIITMEGGTIGREGDHHSLVVADAAVSKCHLTIDYNRELNLYTIKDLGSRNGTRLNGKPLKKYVKYEIEHGSKIELGGDTVLNCHVHQGNQTCGHCEPGLIIPTSKSSEEIANESATSIYDKSVEHRRELRQLRKKFGLSRYDDGARETARLGDGYVDRAKARRHAVGGTDHAEKTEIASINEAIKSTNRGYKMLSKLGWTKGNSLGKGGCIGIKEPIVHMGNVGTTGLGTSTASSSLSSVVPNEAWHCSKGESSRNRTNGSKWEKAMNRYSKLNE